MITFVWRGRRKWRTAVLMVVVGYLFIGLTAVTGHNPLWQAAAAINLLGAAAML